jgi:uncharacterized membrane protein YedE/YeeE
MNIIEFISQPWPWYVAGPLIGLTVPTLLIIGNKTFGISSSMRHICAACLPGNVKFFKYDWKKEIWNLFFVLGVFIGGVVAVSVFANAGPISVNPALAEELKGYGITDYSGMVPNELFTWSSLFTLKGFIMIVVGGFLVGFGTLFAKRTCPSPLFAQIGIDATVIAVTLLSAIAGTWVYGCFRDKLPY